MLSMKCYIVCFDIWHRYVFLVIIFLKIFFSSALSAVTPMPCGQFLLLSHPEPSQHCGYSTSNCKSHWAWHSFPLLSVLFQVTLTFGPWEYYPSFSIGLSKTITHFRIGPSTFHFSLFLFFPPKLCCKSPNLKEHICPRFLFLSCLGWNQVIADWHLWQITIIECLGFV